MGYGYDVNAEKWLSCWRINSLSNPDYYEDLFKYFKSLCIGLGKPKLVIELDRLIYDKIVVNMGCSLSYALFTYKNLPYLNSFTRSLNPDYSDEYIRKYIIKQWLSDIEVWVFNKLAELEPLINFKDNQKIL